MRRVRSVLMLNGGTAQTLAETDPVVACGLYHGEGIRMRNATALAAIIGLLWVAPVSADPPADWQFDDGFTYYEIEDNQDHVDGRAVDAGWYLKANLRVFGTVANRSLFHLKIKKGSQELGEIRCEVDLQNQNRQRADGPAYFQTARCFDREQRITESGDLTIEVYVYDDDSEEEHLIRTHQVHVVVVPRVRGNGDPDAPLHYVDRMGETLTSILHLQHHREDPYMSGRRMDGYSYATLTFSGSPDHDHWSISSSTHLRCRVNGERIPIERDQVTGGEDRNVYLIHTWDRGRQDERAEYNYRQWTIRLPITFNNRIHDATQENRRDPRGEPEHFARLDNHPGQWECHWREGATVLRTFRWVIGEDGRVQVHPEQAAGDLSFGPNSYLVETVIPDSTDAAHDARVNSDVAASRAFHGRGLRTEEGRAMAAALPTRGELEPPQPRAARRGRRGRRGRR